MEFLKTLFGNARFKALLVTLLIAIGAKIGVEEELVQLACDVAFGALIVWLGIEVVVAKKATTPPK